MIILLAGCSNDNTELTPEEADGYQIVFITGIFNDAIRGPE